MKVLVATVSWNYPEYTIAWFNSIKRAVGEIPYHVFIVDNGSTEDNLKRLATLAEVAEIKKNPINSVYNARNQALRKAVQEGYDFVVCSDNDIFYMPSSIRNMIEVGSGPSINMVSPMATYRGGAGFKHQYAYLPEKIEARLREAMKAGQWDDELLLEWYRGHWEYSRGIGQQIKVADALCNMFRTELLEKIGYIDEELGISGQRGEQDYGYRILQAGYRSMICKSSFIYHFNLSTITIARQDHYTRDGNRPTERMEEKFGKDISDEIGKWTREAIYIGGKETWQKENELSRWTTRGTIKPEWQEEMAKDPGERSFIEYNFPGEVRGIPLDHVKRYEFARDIVHDNELSKVLDLGCGCGYGAIIINAEDYTGMDIEPVCIDFANLNIKPHSLLKTSFLIGDAVQTNLEPASIDCCVCFELIEHVEEEKGIKILSECKRILKPGGILLISSPLVGPNGELHSNWHIKEYSLSQFLERLETNVGKVERIFHQRYAKAPNLQNLLLPFSEEYQRIEFSPPAINEGIYIIAEVRT